MEAIDDPDLRCCGGSRGLMRRLCSNPCYRGGSRGLMWHVLVVGGCVAAPPLHAAGRWLLPFVRITPQPDPSRPNLPLQVGTRAAKIVAKSYVSARLGPDLLWF
jgi:hypothetical protein